ALTIATLTSAAAAQVVYEPVRYQFGRYNEVYYGGGNPAICAGASVYLPPSFEGAGTARGQKEPAYLMACTASGRCVRLFSPFVSAFASAGNPTGAGVPPYVFTDLLPFEEAGQFGFTPDDARNEAYANVPRLQVGPEWQGLRQTALPVMQSDVAAAPAPEVVSR